MKYKNGLPIRPFPPVGDVRLAELWGFMLGDGCVSCSGLVLCLKDYEVSAILPLLSLLGKTTFCKKNNSAIFDYRVSNKAMAEEYRKHFYPKHIPDWMKKKGLGYRIRVVRGLFESEGAVQMFGRRGSVSFTNTNREFIDFVARVFGQLSIPFSVYERKPSGVGRKLCFYVVVHKRGVRRFRSAVGFLTESKKSRLKELETMFSIVVKRGRR